MTERTPRTIVVGVDESEQSSAAVRFAARLAERTQDDVLLAHAYEHWPDHTNDPQVDEFRRRGSEGAQQLLDRAAGELGLPAAAIRTVAADERPRTLLARLASEAWLVVVGRDDASLMDRLAFGSVAAHLAKTAPCPVAVVPAGWSPSQFGDHPIVVLSESAADAEIIGAALDQAVAFGRALVVVRPIPYAAAAADVERSERELAEELADRESANPNVTIRRLVVRGDADARLIRLSADASAVVVGRPDGFTRWLRSAAHAVVRRTHCPLIVVPAAGTAGGGEADPHRTHNAVRA